MKSTPEYLLKTFGSVLLFYKSAFFVVYTEHRKQEQIVCYHTRPCGDKTHVQQVNAYKRANDADTPHTENIKFEWSDCINDQHQRTQTG